MWDHFSFVNVQWGIILLQLPTILSLAAFTLLLVPIRIPTLSMITGKIIYSYLSISISVSHVII